MEIALGIIVTILVALVGWVLAHNSQCSRLRERVATLEAKLANMERDK